MGFMDEVSSGGAKYIKYDGRSGSYGEIGSEKTFNGQSAVANIYGAVGGRAKFNGKGEKPEKRMGSIFPKDEAPARATLGDLDRSLWVKGKFSEEPEDPWRPMIELPLRIQDSGEQYMLTATNNNILAAIKDMLGQCRKLPEGFVPVIRFDTASFKGKYGPIKKPILTIVGKVAVEGEGEVEGPYDDEIPL